MWRCLQKTPPFSKYTLLCLKTMDIDDCELVNKCLSGDKNAFEQLVKRHSHRVFRIIHRFFHDNFLIEDIAQEVFIKAYSSLKTYSQKSPFENWLAKITIHTCYRQLQIQTRQKRDIQFELLSGEQVLLDSLCLTPSRSNIMDPEKRVLLRDLVDKIMLQLSPKEKIILILTEVEGMSVKEVSELMGLSLLNIKVRNYRARKHAMKIMKSLSRKDKP